MFAKTLKILLLITPISVGATELSINGYSGKGLIPSTTTIDSGDMIVTYDRTMPGALNTSGYNMQIGFGLYEDLELIGRLATNDLKCNMFKKSACPANTIRDFSASLKWTIPIDWLKQRDSRMAIGVTDVGGAASYFKSYYAVISKDLGPFEVSLGQAKGVSEQALLKGNFGAVTYRPSNWLDVNVQKVGSNSWAVITANSDLPNTSANVYVSFNERLNDAAVTEKKWIGAGVTIPLDPTRTSKQINDTARSNSQVISKKIANLTAADLYRELESKGFYNPTIRIEPSKLQVEIENTSYAWNSLDAAGVALGVIAATHGNIGGQKFELDITTRGISQVILTGEASCLRAWLEIGEVCSSLTINSGLQRNSITTKKIDRELSSILNLSNWSFRPELVLSPTLVSSIGTEYGSFDMDGGVNVNLILPLWTGAIVETNRLKPLGVSTRGFEQGGVFYASRLKPTTSRNLFHQLINISSLNSQARLSLGTAYAAWDGYQIETNTQSDKGNQRISLVTGSFKNDALTTNNQKSYGLMTYRYAHDDRFSTVTEITTGKYWAGDRGWSLGQKFWHGDTSLNLYLRRTRMTDSSPLVSFAGIQFSIPITPRVNQGSEHFALRGSNQWTYNLESRVFNRENLLTGGYGEVPRVGDSLLQTFNRDRNSTRYLESSLIRAKSSFNELSAD